MLRRSEGIEQTTILIAVLMLQDKLNNLSRGGLVADPEAEPGLYRGLEMMGGAISVERLGTSDMNIKRSMGVRVSESILYRRMVSDSRGMFVLPFADAWMCI